MDVVKRNRSGPHVPIGESTDQQWVPHQPSQCPFLEEGEMSFLQRFVTMEQAVVSLTTQVVYLRNSLLTCVLAIVGGIIVSLFRK